MKRLLLKRVKTSSLYFCIEGKGLAQNSKFEGGIDKGLCPADAAADYIARALSSTENIRRVAAILQN